MLKSTPKVLLTFNKVEKTKVENFNFVHLLSSSSSSSFSTFLFARRNLKSTRSMQILNIRNECIANLLHSYLFEASCDLRVSSYGLKTVPKSLLTLKHTLLAFHAIIVSAWHI